jgi:hypothetical protein
MARREGGWLDQIGAQRRHYNKIKPNNKNEKEPNHE